jgi:hypothetical protein
MAEEAKVISIEDLEKLYQNIRIHIPKKYRKGKTSEEIQNMRKGILVNHLLSNGIEIKGIEEDDSPK